ncbi:MAG: hypothetical protein K6B65_02770 [Bacilli bacterium]|nr:hypothetical protein [Bacilli bacterium]
MKKNKSLHRAWIWGYIVLLFGGALLPLLGYKLSPVFAVIAVVFVCLILVDLIVAHVFYAKKRELFPLLSFIGHGALTLSVIFAFILEVVYTSQGAPAPYAWVIGIISMLLMVYVDWRVIGVNKKIIRGEKIIEGKQ